jgi:hypothetical protein
MWLSITFSIVPHDFGGTVGTLLSGLIPRFNAPYFFFFITGFFLSFSAQGLVESPLWL